MQKNANLFLLSLVFASVVLLSACQNTVQGFGKDMQHNGQEIQKAANDN